MIFALVFLLQSTLQSRVQTGVAAYERGDRAAAYQIFDAVRKEPRARLNSNELVAVATSLKYLGDNDPQLFKEALDVLDDAIAADGNNVAARLALGRLFLDKYNAPEAIAVFDELLAAHPSNADALIGKAEALDFLSQPGAPAIARAALRADATNVRAREYLTREFLSENQVDSARVYASGSDISAAALAQVQGNDGELNRIRAQLNGNSTMLARLDATLAELNVQQRQYAEAVRLAKQAIAENPTLWSAHATLGINQLRLGDPHAARTTLQAAFQGDPYNVWVKNSLDLLDRLATFTTANVGRFTVVASKRDADVLTPYVQLLGEEALDSMARRYNFTPQTPVRVELYDRHADFSVRTVGLAGLGALGVSFGNVLALDAPSSRDRGEFNWGSTLWHELAHAFHLGMTNHRVPRWFTEGLAVWEERRARAGWGDEGLPVFMSALRSDKLLPLADLNSGFVRPTYPQQVGVSYYQASLVLEMIERQYGAKALREMLQEYARGRTTDVAFQNVLHKTTAQVDADFRAFLTQWVKSVPDKEAAARREAYDSLTARATTATLERAMYISPYDPVMHQKLAEQYAANRAWSQAVRERRVIVALQPVDMAEARYQLAFALYSAGNKAEARREVLRALEIAPNFAKAQDLLIKLQDPS